MAHGILELRKKALAASNKKILFILSMLASVLFFYHSNGVKLSYFQSLKLRDSVMPRGLVPQSLLNSRPSWTFENTPEFCKQIVADPKAYSGCEISQETKLCEDRSAVMFSQFFQDYYLYTRHFSKLSRKGTYVDLAANHPWKISNSFFMDTCLGWNGLCIEALSVYEKLLKEERSCTVIPNCISHKDGDEISFIQNGVYSGSAETNKLSEKWNKTGAVFEKVPMKCITLKSLFKKYEVGLVDYLSLDVEGHELMVLKGISWKKVKINIITVEITPKSLQSIDNFLEKKGFSRHTPDLNEGTKRSRLLKEDAIYVHNSVVFGRPE